MRGRSVERIVHKGSLAGIMENIMAILVTLCLMGAVTGVNPSGKLNDLQHEIFLFG
jgi:hypothetical protein